MPTAASFGYHISPLKAKGSCGSIVGLRIRWVRTCIITHASHSLLGRVSVYRINRALASVRPGELHYGERETRRARTHTLVLFHSSRGSGKQIGFFSLLSANTCMQALSTLWWRRRVISHFYYGLAWIFLVCFYGRSTLVNDYWIFSIPALIPLHRFASFAFPAWLQFDLAQQMEFTQKTQYYFQMDIFSVLF